MEAVRLYCLEVHEIDVKWACTYICVFGTERVHSETEWGIERFCKVNKRRELVLDWCHTYKMAHDHGLESPVITPPGMQDRVHKLHQGHILQEEFTLRHI